MKYGAVFLIAILLGSVVFAQQQQSDDDVVRVKSNLVNIDVIVKDKKGKYVPDLKAEDFTVVENGVAQKIEFFDAPLSRTDARSPNAAAPDATTTTTPPSAAPRCCGCSMKSPAFAASSGWSSPTRRSARSLKSRGSIAASTFMEALNPPPRASDNHHHRCTSP